MKTYCLSCEKHTDNIGLKKKIMTNKVVRQSSKCANCANNDYQYKMNEIENKFLLVEDKFMLEMHLKQPGFTYSVCGPFTKDKRIIMQTGTGNYIY